MLYPLKVTLTNVAEDALFSLPAPDFPAAPGGAAHALPLTRTVYIERADFREADEAGYFGLAPGKVAGLRYAGYVRVTGVVRDAAGAVAELTAEYDAERSAAFAGAAKVRGNLHWVSGAAPGAAPAAVEVRLFDHLFAEPAEPGAEPLLNPASEVVVAGALADAALAAPGRVARRAHFQFERVGFFTADDDSRPEEGKLVFNMTVGLKEGAEAKKARA